MLVLNAKYWHCIIAFTVAKTCPLCDIIYVYLKSRFSLKEHLGKYTYLFFCCQLNKIEGTLMSVRQI